MRNKNRKDRRCSNDRRRPDSNIVFKFEPLLFLDRLFNHEILFFILPFDYYVAILLF